MFRKRENDQEVIKIVETQNSEQKIDESSEYAVIREIQLRKGGQRIVRAEAVLIIIIAIEFHRFVIYQGICTTFNNISAVNASLETVWLKLRILIH